MRHGQTIVDDVWEVKEKREVGRRRVYGCGATEKFDRNAPSSLKHEISPLLTLALTIQNDNEVERNRIVLRIAMTPVLTPASHLAHALGGGSSIHLSDIASDASLACGKNLSFKQASKQPSRMTCYQNRRRVCIVADDPTIHREEPPRCGLYTHKAQSGLVQRSAHLLGIRLMQSQLRA